MTFRLMACGMAVGLALGLSACGGGTTQQANSAAAKQPATAPAAGSETVRGELISDWQGQKDMMVKIADAMSENKFGFKATPAERSYGEQIMHIALVNVDLLKVVGGKAAAPTFTADSATTKADILKALGDSYDYGTALLNEQTGATIVDTVDAAFLGKSTRARVFGTLLAHSMDIYGQMAVYLRLNGIVPPASRGV